MRALFVRLHRWFGLAAAAFLFVSGLTGAVISWDHEIDGWLNPRLYRSATPGPAREPLRLVRDLEAADPRLQVTYQPLAVQPGQAFVVFVQPRTNPATGQPWALDHNQIALDPVTGQVQGRRLWGAVSLSRENLLPFLYKLHYSMHIPAGFGIELGVWFMGLLAIAWVLDCVVALAIAFPSRASWRRSFAFRWRAGGHKLAFDLHRSGGVWLWALVALVAVTSVAMNLRDPVLRPLVAWFSPLSPSPLDRVAPSGVPLAVSAEQAVAVAAPRARRLGITAPPGGLFLSTAAGVWGVGFFEPGREHGDVGLGNPWLYVDAGSGAIAGAQVPGQGSAGDLFLQAMFPLHSGRIIGVPGRVLMSLMGLAVAALSATGVWIWLRKRRARAMVRGWRFIESGA